MKTELKKKVRNLFNIIYRLRLGIKLVLTPGTVAIGVTLNSGVENCSFFELLAPLRFKIGVVIDGPGLFCSIFNSIKLFVLPEAAASDTAAMADVDATAFCIPEFELIAIACRIDSRCCLAND